MIPWVNEACKAWGRAQYWLLYGRNGWPSRTMLGKMIDEGLVGAAAGQWGRVYPEVLTGQNLVTGNAVKRLAESHRSLVTVHYVFRGTARQKCKIIHVPIRTYYAQIDSAHFRLGSLIEEEDARISARTCSTPEELHSKFQAGSDNFRTAKTGRAIFLYAIRSGERIKFGVAFNIEQRLSQLQSANPDELNMIGYLEASRDIEQALLEYLSAERIKGEWFDWCARTQAVASLIQQKDLASLLMFIGIRGPHAHARKVSPPPDTRRAALQL